MTGSGRDPQVSELARPLRDPGDLDPLLERIGSARIVLLGEASHGTHEYHAWRTALTRRLVTEAGSSFVAVEGDWPDCHRVDCSVTLASGPEDPREVLQGYARWPTWMWANEEVADLTRWLREHNAFCWFDESRALNPLHDVGATGGEQETGEQETWPDAV